MMKKRIAVVLFNLGGPHKKEDIKPFLFNFFMDKNIIRAPWPVRFLVANIIAISRSRKQAGESYSFLGGGSPLLKNSQEQADALLQVLQTSAEYEFCVEVCMRYWHPMTDEVVAKIIQWGPDRVVLLPLYPQYSTTTTRSSLQQWNDQVQKQGLKCPTTLICCYPESKGYIEASVENIRTAYAKALAVSEEKKIKAPRLLFSAHGLPEDIIREGDPYQAQCERSAQAIVKALKIEKLDWTVCYQSKVGPKKWIEPSTEDELRRAAADQVPVIIYPHAFVNEHVETLVEIEIEYRELAHELGVPHFERVPTVATHGSFISDLAQTVTGHARQSGIFPYGGQRVCPLSSRQCCQSECMVESGV